MFQRMAKDGLIPEIFSVLNRYQVPVFGTMVTGIVSGLIGFLFDIETLTSMISIGTLLAFTVVDASVIIQRYQSKDKPSFTIWMLIIYTIASSILSSFPLFDFASFEVSQVVICCMMFVGMKHITNI